MTNSILLFGVAPKGATTKELIQQCNLEALKSGFIVEPECCTEDVLEFFKNWTANYDSTFYKTWQDMKSKSREEIMWDQIFHYMTTIWVDYQWGYGLIPNDHNYEDQPEIFKELKIVKAISMPELLERCYELDNSGIALSNEVVDFIVDVFAQCHPEGCQEEDIIGFTNKELRAKLFAAYNIIPLDAFDILRYIATKSLGNAMIIQNKESIKKIKAAQKDANKRFDFSKLDEKRMIALSSIFLRFKNWILAFKDKSIENNHAINKLRRLAKTHHKPITIGFWEDVLAKKPNLDVVVANLSTLSIWKRIKIMQACKEHIAQPEYKSYLIRNQKLYYKQASKEESIKYYEALYLILKTTLPKKKVRLPKNIILAAPSSEKSFVGNYPLGSKFRFEDSAFAGMYWKKGWGQIFDVHYFTNEPFSNSRPSWYDQRHVGWNSQFKLPDNSIMFSGDVCSPNPDATDVMLIKKSAPAGYFTINYYSMHWDGGNSERRCDFILGYGNENGTRMVNPADIVFRIPLEFTQPQKIVGYFADGEFTLGMFDVPGGQVPTFQEGLSKTLQARCQSYVPLSDLVEVVPDDYEGDNFVDLSGDLNKDDIIKLLSE